MDSMPPATTMLAEPAWIRSWASITAFIPEPQTLLMVVQGRDLGRPAPRDAWRAGAWPSPAGSTQPMITSESCSFCTPASATAASMAAEPSWVALTFENWPWKEPMAVRRAETMTTGSAISNSKKEGREFERILQDSGDYLV